jgi:hypothetical protein
MKSKPVLILGLIAINLLILVIGGIFVTKAIGEAAEGTAEHVSEAATEITKTGADLVKSGGRAFERIVNATPQVIVKGDSVILEKSSITELAIVQRKTKEYVKHTSKWLRSENILIISGEFIVKAGFDLNKHFEMSINQELKQITILLPEPEILSVDALADSHALIFTEDGTINKVKPEDYERANIVLLKKARTNAENSDILTECKQQIQTRLEDLLGMDFDYINVEFADPESSVEIE